MAITTAQRKQIINWVNSNDFNKHLKEIIYTCNLITGAHFILRSQGINNHLSSEPVTPESIVAGYLVSAKIPFVHSPSMKKYIIAEILKKYGSLLDRTIKERLCDLRIKNIQTDF